MKKYKIIFFSIILSIKIHSMDDFHNQQNEAKSGQHTLSKDYAIVLNQLIEAVKRLNETSESCIKRLIECGHKLDYIKGFDSIGDIDQHVTYLDRYISSEKTYINRLRHPDSTMDSTAHDAAKLILLLENMIKNAEEKKELAIAGAPKIGIQRLEIAHKEIIIRLQSLLLLKNILHKNCAESSILYHLDNLNSKIQSTIEYIHRHLESDVEIYHLLDTRSRGDYFDKTKDLLSENATRLRLVSQEIQIVSAGSYKIYHPLNRSWGKLPPPNGSKRDS